MADNFKLPVKLTLSIVAGIDGAMHTKPTLEEAVRKRYVQHADLESLISGNKAEMDHRILIQSISELQVNSDRDRWKIAFEETLKYVSRLDTPPTDTHPTRHDSLVCNSPPQKGGKKAEPKPSKRDGLVQKALGRSNGPPTLEDCKQLYQKLLSRGPLYNNKYHRYITCSVQDCEFCNQMFVHTEITLCANYGHTPCHSCGYYPHVGLHLWKQLKASHNCQAVYRPSIIRKLRHTLMNRIIDPAYNDRIDRRRIEIEQQFCNTVTHEASPEIEFKDSTPVYNPKSPDMIIDSEPIYPVSE